MEFAKFIWPLSLTIIGVVWSIVYGITKMKTGEIIPECITNFKRVEKNADKQWSNIHATNQRTQEVEIELVKLKKDITYIRNTVDKTHKVIIRNGGKK